MSAHISNRVTEHTRTRHFFHRDTGAASRPFVTEDHAYLIIEFGPEELTVSGPAGDLVEWTKQLAAYAEDAFGEREQVEQ